MDDAQLFWDDATGWWLRYVDDNGSEQGYGVDGAEDAGLVDLAPSVAAVVVDVGAGDGKVRVFRGETERGWIKIKEGAPVDWSEL